MSGINVERFRAATRPSHYQRGLLLLIISCVSLTIIAFSLCAISVRQGLLSPPWFDQNVGKLRLIGYSTRNPGCPPYLDCAPTLDETYVVWLVVDPSISVSQFTEMHRLVRVPLSHGR